MLSYWPDAQHIQVGKIHYTIGIKIFIADISTAKDSGYIIYSISFIV